MAVNVRTFNGTTDQLLTTLGSLGFAFGPGSIGMLLKASSFAAFPTVMGINDATNGYGIYMATTTSQFSAYTQAVGGGANAGGGQSTGIWYFVIATKATGSVPFRIHVYDCTAGTWTHNDTTTSVGNSTISAAGMKFANGSANANPLAANVYLAAVWNTALSDAACAALVSRSAVVASSPVALWFFDQASIATPVPDSVGTANQTSITGTSVTTDTIPNFDTSVSVVTPTPSVIVPGQAARRSSSW